MKPVLLSFFVVLIAVLLITCEKPERNNPWDENNTLDPEAWAPENFQIEDVAFTEKKLSWSYDDKNIEGFKLDRKRGDEPWKVNFQTFLKTQRAYLDTISLNPAIYYYYRLYAYAGQNTSAAKDTSFLATIPAPIDFTITVNSISSVTLSWGYHLDGYEGFKIERKQSDGNWILLSTTSNTTIIDNSFELNTQVYYRVSAYVGQHSSEFALNNFNSTIPPPENLAITANSATSVTLNWNYSLTGHEGFKIERKIDNGSWDILEDNLNPNQNSFDDNGLDLNSYKYHYRVYAYLTNYNSRKPEQSITFIFDCGTKITDTRDGNEYETVQIGNQCWMKENLKWLPSVNPSENGSNTIAYYYVYDYQGTSVSAAKVTNNYLTYGVLYNWPAALNACPDGWHLPTDNEWTILINYLGGSSVAGGKMKTTGTTHWDSPNTGATNSSSFSGLPGGDKSIYYFFSSLKTDGYWWSSSEYGGSAWFYSLTYESAEAYRYVLNKEAGRSVRCLLN